EMLKAADLAIPFIVVSGTVGENAAVAVMRSGARDDVFKDKLSRLRPVVEREVLAAVERRAARAAQSEYLRRLGSIFDSALDAVVTMGADGVITDWNPMAESIFGWPRSDAVGRLVSETIIPVRYRGAHKFGLRRFLETGEGPVLNKRLELAALHRDGHEFPIELSISATSSGGSHLFSAFVRDITERHHAEEALRASEERYRQIVETAFEGVWVIDSNNRTTFLNQRMAEMLGYAPEEMLGNPVLTSLAQRGRPPSPRIATSGSRPDSRSTSSDSGGRTGQNSGCCWNRVPTWTWQGTIGDPWRWGPTSPSAGGLRKPFAAWGRGW